MTTIACDLEKMVSDSRVSISQKGLSYPAVKIVRVGKTIVGAAGDGGDCSRFLKWAANGFKGAEPKWGTPSSDEDSVIGLILNEEGIHVWFYGDPEPEKVMGDSYAIGSGGKAARVAMILGADPVKAVELAMQVDDLNSGPPLQILELHEKVS